MLLVRGYGCGYELERQQRQIERLRERVKGG
jgi:hypothetical protein